MRDVAGCREGAPEHVSNEVCPSLHGQGRQGQEKNQEPAKQTAVTVQLRHVCQLLGTHQVSCPGPCSTPTGVDHQAQLAILLLHLRRRSLRRKKKEESAKSNRGRMSERNSEKRREFSPLPSLVSVSDGGQDRQVAVPPGVPG